MEKYINVMCSGWLLCSAFHRITLQIVLSIILQARLLEAVGEMQGSLMEVKDLLLVNVILFYGGSCM